MTDLPSYARPTAASEFRRSSRSQDANTPSDYSLASRSRRMPVDLSSPRVLHGYSLSTISWRHKARWPGPFRFLDLPPELRNRVYEYLTLGPVIRCINLYHINPGEILQCIPSLLATNKQLCNEGGGYYFSDGFFVLVINSYRVDELRSWLTAIGPENRQRLANNRDVMIRLVLQCDTLSRREHRSYYGIQDGCVRHNLLSDTAYLVGLGSEFDKLVQRHPALKGWYVEAYASRLKAMQEVLIPCKTSYRRSPTPISYFEQLQPFLDQLFELFEGTPARTLGGQRQLIRDGPIWAARKQRKGVGKIKLPSGRKVFIDSRA